MAEKQFSRRKVLEQLGVSAGALAGISGVAVAEDGADGNEHGPRVQTEELPHGRARQKFRKATTDGPGYEMAKFLEARQYRTDLKSLTGKRVRAQDIPEHVVVDAPIREHRERAKGRRRRRDEAFDVGQLQMRIYDEEVTPRGMGRAVTVQTIAEGAAYMSNPLTAEDVRTSSAAVPSSIQAAANEVDGPVVPVEDWQNQPTSQLAVASSDWPWNCMVSGTYSAGGPACMILGGLTGIAGAVLTLIPEPGTTAVGTVALGTALSGSCTLAEGLEAALDTDCEINSIGMCVTWPGFFSPPDIYIFPAGDCYVY